MVALDSGSLPLDSMDGYLGFYECLLGFYGSLHWILWMFVLDSMKGCLVSMDACLGFYG